MAAKRHQPLFEDISSTEITPLSKSLRERLQASDAMRPANTVPDAGAVAAPVPLKPVLDAHERRLPKGHAVELQQAVARRVELDELEPLANLLAPPPPPPSAVSRPSRISKQLVIQTIERHPWWLGILAFLTVLSVALNGVAFLALRSVHQQLQAARSRLVTGSVVTPAPGAATGLTDAPSCVAESSQTISGSDRDRMLLDAIRQHEQGRHQESLQAFKLYVHEACDAATLQAVTILERELSPPKKERAR